MKFIVTAEHCNGQSVDHPCRNGVYGDPANALDLIIEAASAEEAEQAGYGALYKAVAESEPCQCHYPRQPGSDAWWGSVAIHADALIEPDPDEQKRLAALNATDPAKAARISDK